MSTLIILGKSESEVARLESQTIIDDYSGSEVNFFKTSVYSTIYEHASFNFKGFLPQICDGMELGVHRNSVPAG
jgi:hypothetical protein